VYETQAGLELPFNLLFIFSYYGSVSQPVFGLLPKIAHRRWVATPSPIIHEQHFHRNTHYLHLWYLFWLHTQLKGTRQTIVMNFNLTVVVN